MSVYYPNDPRLKALIERIDRNLETIAHNSGLLVEALQPQLDRVRAERNVSIESDQRRTGDVAAEWTALGLSARVANALGRSKVDPPSARSMTDAELAATRNVGRKAIEAVRAVL